MREREIVSGRGGGEVKTEREREREKRREEKRESQCNAEPDDALNAEPDDVGLDLQNPEIMTQGKTKTWVLN